MMYLLTKYEQFKKEYSKLKNNFGKVYCNCLFPSKIISEIISENNCFLTESNNGFLILTSKDSPKGFLKVYYFLGDCNSFPVLPANCPLIVEEIDICGKKSNYLEKIIAILAEAGFHETAKNVYVEISLKESSLYSLIQASLEQLANNCYYIDADPDEKYIKEGFKLWERYLKPTDIPEEHYQTSLTKKNHILTVLDKNQKVCGVNWWAFHNNICEIRHTVTHPNYYRQNIGTSMILYALNEGIINGCHSAYTFIDSNNTISIKMYEKIGFRLTEKISRQFIFSEKKQ